MENPDQIRAALDKRLQDLTKAQQFSGSFLLAKNGGVLLSKGYGLADREKKTPITAQTKFRIGTTTKQFTAMAIMLLQEQGKLNVQDKICTYLTDCPEAWKAITIHQLLTQTSGIPDNSDAFITQDITSSAPLENMIAEAKKLPLDFQPGERYSNNSMSYILLGKIIEAASGGSYEAFLQKNIFEPLQMSNTGFDPNRSDVAVGYMDQNAVADPINLWVESSAAGLYSTVEDLYRYDQALNSGKLVPQKVLDAMSTSYVQSDREGLGFGYGWYVALKRPRLVKMPANGNGFDNIYRRYPEDGFTIIELSNEQDYDNVTVANWIQEELSLGPAPAAISPDASTSGPAPWSLVAVGDSVPYNSPDDCSGCTGFVDRYATAITQATGHPVEVQNLSQHNGLQIDGLLEELKSDVKRRDALANADIIVVSIGSNNTAWNANDDPCDGPTNDYPDWSKFNPTCAAAAAELFRPRFESVFAQIVALRAGKPTIFRTTNSVQRLDRGENREWRDVPPEARTATRAVLDAWDAMVCKAAQANGFTCADVYHAFNGPDGLKPEVGDLTASKMNGYPSDKGNAVIAGVLADLGYAPLVPTATSAAKPTVAPAKPAAAGAPAFRRTFQRAGQCQAGPRPRRKRCDGRSGGRCLRQWPARGQRREVAAKHG